ncbi:helix-turn-helix transcriptional regulator [bacterium]|nr:helix-turn-helix transcriptional regulator [bacterium]
MAAMPESIAEGIALDLALEFEKRRDELGLSYAEIARRMGVSRQRVHRLFSGTQNSTIGSLLKLALVLDCNLEINIAAQVPEPDAVPAKKKNHKPAAKARPQRKSSRVKHHLK